jgi:hypothetical protein
MATSFRCRLVKAFEKYIESGAEIAMKKKIQILMMLLAISGVAYIVYRFINRPEDNQVTGVPDARAAWVDVLSRCATTELLGSDVFYFGASNTIGPGSVWRKDSDGSLRLRFDLNELEPDPAKRDVLIQSGNAAACSGQNSRNWNVSLGLPFESQIAGVDGTLAGELRKARTVTVGVTGWSANLLRERAYEQLLKSKPDYGAEFDNDDRFVAENAILVSGFTSVFEFDKSAVGDVQAKVKAGQVELTNGTKLDAAWESGNTLRLTSSKPFYILAAIGQVTKRKDNFVFGKQSQVNAAALRDDREVAQNDLLIRRTLLAKLPDGTRTQVNVHVTDGKVSAVAGNPAQGRQVEMAASDMAQQRATSVSKPAIYAVEVFDGTKKSVRAF